MTYFEAGEWPVLYAGAGCSLLNDSGMEAIRLQFESIAATLLWNWTNRVFSTRTEVIRPCRVVLPWRPSSFEGLGPPAAYYDLAGGPGWGWLPVYSATSDSWFNLRCGRCGGVACGCEPNVSKAIHLPGPVESVGNVTIGALELDPAAYRVDNKRTLIRQDGDSWPTTQDLIEPLGSENTWSITFTRGVPVPLGGQYAAGLLACELYKAETADPTCGLPSRVKTVSRQGVTVGILDTFEGLDEGKSGLWSVDAWIASVTRPRDYVGIASPDTVAQRGWAYGSPV